MQAPTAAAHANATAAVTGEPPDESEVVSEHVRKRFRAFDDMPEVWEIKAASDEARKP